MKEPATPPDEAERFPLHLGEGSAIGTLCIIDKEPRHLAEEDFEMLKDLGHMVERELASLQMATTDELTGLSNRRGFNMLPRQNRSRARSSIAELCPPLEWGTPPEPHDANRDHGEPLRRPWPHACPPLPATHLQPRRAPPVARSAWPLCP